MFVGRLVDSPLRQRDGHGTRRGAAERRFTPQLSYLFLSPQRAFFVKIGPGCSKLEGCVGDAGFWSLESSLCVVEIFQTREKKLAHARGSHDSR